MSTISLSIIPCYYCKTDCKYCYLGHLRKDRTILSIDQLDEKLSILDHYQYTIDSVSVYGGEISLLDDQYLTEMVENIRTHIGESIPIGFCTSGYDRRIFSLAKQLGVGVTIPVNQERPDYKKNVQLAQKYDCSIGVVVLPSIINTPADQLVEFYDQLKRDVYFYQYYPSVYVQSPYTFSCQQYTEFLIAFINEYNKKERSFELINLNELYNDNYNPESSGFIYIMPNGKWATTKYTNCVESFVYFDTINQWKAHCINEHFQRLEKCGQCTMFHRCKAEHLAVMNEEYCSGLKKLIKPSL